MSTTVSAALTRLGLQPASQPLVGQVGRLYVADTDRTVAALAELGPQARVVAHEGVGTHVVHGTTRPVG